MKHWYLSFLACLISLLGQAQTVPAALVVVSRETPGVTGTLSFQVLVVAQSAGPASYNLQVASPTFILQNHAASRTYATLSQNVQAGDTLRTTINLQYDPGSIPFALEKMDIRLLDLNGKLVFSAPAFVFFTPYDTVELWGRGDLDII